MPKTYAYKAKDRSGQMLTGSLFADNEQAVASYIREKGYFIIQIKAKAGESSFIDYFDKFRSISMKELAILCNLFSTMIDAGMSIVACLDILIQQTENKRLKKALQDVYRKVNEGETLSSSLRSHPRIFPGIMINMVESGEVGGVLDQVLNRLANHFEKEYKMKGKIKSALTYPAIISAMATVVVILMVTFVVPNFVQMFATMNMKLPLSTQILLAIGNFFRDYIIVIIGGSIAIFYGMRIAYQKAKIKKVIDTIILLIPVVGMLSRKIAIARFSRTLSTLLHGGVSIITAIEVVQKTIGNLVMIDALQQAHSGLKDGMGLAKTLQESKVFTPMVIKMVSIGEDSGSLDKMLGKIADFYENDVDDVVSRLSVIIEPIIIGILGLVIGAIVISLMLPMLEIMTGIGNQ